MKAHTGPGAVSGEVFVHTVSSLCYFRCVRCVWLETSRRHYHLHLARLGIFAFPSTASPAKEEGLAVSCPIYKASADAFLWAHAQAFWGGLKSRLQIGRARSGESLAGQSGLAMFECPCWAWGAVGYIRHATRAASQRRLNADVWKAKQRLAVVQHHSNGRQR